MYLQHMSLVKVMKHHESQICAPEDPSSTHFYLKAITLMSFFSIENESFIESFPKIPTIMINTFYCM